MSSFATPIAARQMITSMAAHSATALPALVKSLAIDGQLGLLRSIFADGLISPSEWSADKHMAYAILPLARRAPPGEQGVARALVQDWLVAFKGTHLADMTAYFISSPDADVSRELLARGVDPLTPIDWTKKQLRAKVFDLNNHHSMVALLDVPGAANDASFISLMLTGFAKHMHQQQQDEDAWAAFWKQAEQCGMLAAGAVHISDQLPSILQAAAESVLEMAGFDDPYAEPSIKRWLQALLWADLPPHAWEDVLELGAAECQLGTAMATDPDLAPFVVPVIAHMGRAVVPIDTLRVRCAGAKEPGTMLHAAMLADNAPVVLALLEAGADPDATLSIRGKIRNAASIAPKSLEAVQALTAWRARRAMHSVVKSGAARPRSENP